MSDEALEFLNKVKKYKDEGIEIKIIFKVCMDEPLEFIIHPSKWRDEAIEDEITDNLHSAVWYAFKKIQLVVDNEVKYSADDINDWEELIKKLDKNYIIISSFKK